MTQQTVTETEYEAWRPTKGADAYTDDELRQTPLFERMRKLCIMQVGSTKTPLSEEPLLRIARNAISEMWEQIQTIRFAPQAQALFAALDGGNFWPNSQQQGDAVIVGRDGSVKPAKRAAASAAEGGRFKPQDYARFIKRGNGHKSAQHGGFVHVVSQAKNEARNGEYELVILPGIQGNQVTDVFSAKLYQRPANGAKLPVICFPPIKGTKKDHRAGLNLRRDDQVIEVSSMSKMLKESGMNNPQTPSIVFGLDALLQQEVAAQGGTAQAAPRAEDEDEDEDANAASLLDDESEDEDYSGEDD